MLIGNGEKIVFMGDSVTDDGRGRPIGELAYGLGNGYVNQIHSFLNIFDPTNMYRLVNVGVSGETIADIKKRWQTDVFDQKPDWLSICIGINDVWNQFQRPLQYEIHVYPDEYKKTLEELIVQTKPTVKGLILMTPYFMEVCKDDAMRKMMDEYGAIVKELAAKHGAICVDLQAAFDDFFQHRYSAFVAWDRVHPNHIGAMIIALAFLKAVDFNIARV